MYADGTTLHCADGNINNLCNKLSYNLKIINKWLKCNYLTLNKSKTKYNIFSYKNIPDNISISLNNVELQHNTNLNFLDLIINNKLTFRNHIEYVT